MTPQQYEQLFSGFSFNNSYLSDDITYTQVSGKTHIDVVITYVSASTVYMSDYLGYPGDIYDPMQDIIGDSEYAGQDDGRIYDLFFMDGQEKKHLESFWFDENGDLVFSPVIP